VLLYHGGYRADALRTLAAFQQWKATARLTSTIVEISDTNTTVATQSPDFVWVAGDPVLAARLALREDEALAKVVVELNRDALEHQFADV
jgi:hypothetical protein